MSAKQSKTEEEVDLGSLFTIIGKGVSKVFNFIANIFIAVFNTCIILLLFLRKHVVKMIAVGIVFGIVGFILEYNDDDIYDSKMLVKPNFNSVRQLYANIELYNNLIYQEEFNLLKEIFKISEEEAISLRLFSIEPVENENDIINAYDKLTLSVDTLAIKNYELEDFKKSFTSYDYIVYEIKVKSTNNKIFAKLDDIILSSIKDHDYFKRVKETENLNLDRSYALLQKNIKEADTLRKVYTKVLLEEAKKPTTGTSIDMGNRNNKDKELELFRTSREINSRLSQIAINKTNKKEIINVISSFQVIGTKVGGLKNSKTFVFFVFGVLVTLLVLLLKEVNIFLNNYKK
ncbi:MAG: hypothetical protein GKR88_20780 [Flavobacteriaceae bacterium]|nr:MAG: hypothetical protein GKR88_20780 [Flavobacteriaceae bacterium]